MRRLLLLALPACSSAPAKTSPPVTVVDSVAIDAAPAPTPTPDYIYDDADLPTLEAACAEHKEAACTELGNRYRSGIGTDQDFARAAQIWTETCDAAGGVSDACVGLSSLYLDGFGVTKDLRRAVAILRTSCDGDNAWSCSFLGLVLTEGLAVPEVRYDDAALREGVVMYQRGCDLGRGGACSHLAGLYDSNRLGDPDPDRAAALRERACTLDPEEC